MLYIKEQFLTVFFNIENAANYGEGMEPVFYSGRVMFMVILKNLNYKMLINEAENEAESEAKSEAKSEAENIA